MFLTTRPGGTRSSGSWTGGGTRLLNSVTRRRSGREGLGPTSPAACGCGCALSRRHPGSAGLSSRHVSPGPGGPSPVSAVPASQSGSEDQTQNIMGSEAPSASSFQMLLLLLLLLLRAERLRGAELTFELPDNAKQCFHEEVEQGVKFSLDYQVRP